jgi:thiaminase/transcriptional activator TenA
VSLSGRLWHEHSDVATRALAHPFIRGIADGTLDPRLFAGYVGQDAFFLEAFARAYALALAASPDTDTVLAFADLIGGVRDELTLHSGYAELWGFEPWAAEPAPATLAYTDFLLATAATRALGPICAAMTPCMRLYAYLGESLAAEGPQATAEANPYRSWTTAYADPEFAAFGDRLERLLDRHASDEAAARSVYRRAMHLELAFFDAAFAA